MDTKTNKPVLVTTEFRGVFFGYVKDDSKLPAEITLTNVRNAMYWSSDVGGFLGLTVTGPNSSCKIGKEAQQLTLYKVTSISECTEEAAKAWAEA